MINSFHGDYEFLSNFYECPVIFDGIAYRNSEAAFQAQKTTSNEERMKFSKLDASAAKHLGRRVTLRKDWKAVKVNLMYQICKAKFEQNPSLAQKLLSTGSQMLEEGNNWGDRIWGTVNGEGKNLLGQILMHIREEITIELSKK